MMFPKPRPKLLDKRKAKAALDAIDRAESAKVRARSGGQCEVRVVGYSRYAPMELFTDRCERRAAPGNHHLIGGIGRRNKGRSILAAHRLDACVRCHQDITGNVLVPIDGTKKEDAATVRYERVKLPKQGKADSP